MALKQQQSWSFIFNMDWIAHVLRSHDQSCHAVTKNNMSHSAFRQCSRRFTQDKHLDKIPLYSIYIHIHYADNIILGEMAILEKLLYEAGKRLK